jgi:hypothetical protein
MRQLHWLNIAACILCSSVLTPSTAAGTSPAATKNGEPEFWIGTRQEIAAADCYYTECLFLLPRVRVGVGVRKPRASVSLVVDNGPLIWLKGGELDSVTFLTEIAFLPAGRIQLRRGAFRIGPRLGVAFGWMSLQRPVEILSPTDSSHLYGSVGLNMAWDVPSAARGPTFMIGFEPAVIVPWLVRSFSLNLAVLVP